MTSPRSSFTSESGLSSSASIHSSHFLLTPSTLLSEKLSSLPHPRSLSIASIVSLGNLRRRAILATLFAIFAGILFANVFFNFASSGPNRNTYNDFQNYLSQHLNSHQSSSQTDNVFLAGSKPTVVALVSFNSRSRTEILDCYLQQNLIHHGGLIDRVIFTSETDSEDELDWLAGLVYQTDGYNLISTSSDSSSSWHDSLSDKLIPLRGDEEVGGSIGRSWKLAGALAKNMSPMMEPGHPEPLFLFVNSETIYLSPTAIASMIQTQQTQPEYSIIQANIVNQPILSWLHNKMGVVKPYRPEIQYSDGESEVLSAEWNPASESSEPDRSVFDELRDQLRGVDDKSKRSEQSPSSWRASELPLWSPGAVTSSLNNIDYSAPLLFGVPIDFQPPTYKHRWLPYDSRQPVTATGNEPDFHQRPSLSSPITQQGFSLTGPGKWPWILSAQQLYSFLEHLEEEADNSDLQTNASTAKAQPTRQTVSGLSRYGFPLYIPSPIPPLAPTLFLLSSTDLLTLTPTFPFHPSNPAQENEEPFLAHWLASDAVTNALDGRGVVVDGNAVAARFLPGKIERSEWEDDGGGGEVRRGLEGTDLLERFRAHAEETGCRAAR